MPYAGFVENNVAQVSSDPFPGSIEITEQQYRQAIDGMCEGRAFSIEGGFSLTSTPQSVEAELLSPDVLVARAFALREQLLAIAANRMAPLQDAVDLGEADLAEENSLLNWKRYRVALNRVEHQAGFPDQVDWPISPDAPVTLSV